MMLFILLFSSLLSASTGWSVSGGDFPWALPCDKHGLCRRMVAARAPEVAACARAAGGVGAAGGGACAGVDPGAPVLDCFSGGTALLRFAPTCALAECLEVASFAASPAACAEWFPPRRSVRLRRRAAAALAAVRAGAGDAWMSNASAAIGSAIRAAAALLEKPLPPPR